MRRELSKREWQVCELLLEACSNREIAERLGITVRTVKMHFNRLYALFGIDSGIKRVKLARILYDKKYRPNHRNQGNRVKDHRFE